MYNGPRYTRCMNGHWKRGWETSAVEGGTPTKQATFWMAIVTCKPLLEDNKEQPLFQNAAPFIGTSKAASGANRHLQY